MTWIVGCCKRTGLYVVSTYLLTKILFIINLLIQFRILNYFLGPGHEFQCRPPLLLTPSDALTD